MAAGTAASFDRADGGLAVGRAARRPGSPARARSVLTVAVAVILAAVLVVTLVPLRTTTAFEERVVSYSVVVPAHGFGTTPISHGFLGLCNGGALPSQIVGNQTVWLRWQVSGGPDPSYVRLQILLVGTLYNVSGTANGSYAASSSTELSRLCGSNPIFAAYSNSSTAVALQVGLVYDRSVTAPIL